MVEPLRYLHRAFGALRLPLLEGFVLGITQGITEWLPISSQGTVSAMGSFFFDLTLAEAVAFALWLHVGTAIAAVIAFRSEIVRLLREMLSDPLHPSALLRFAVVGTVVSVAIGFPIILALDEISAAVGSGAMIVIGVAMLGTALVLRAQPYAGTKTRVDLTLIDALTFGVAQGFAAVPGFSRSGLTVAALLGRRVNRAEALAISFLMSIPASAGAALFAGLEDGNSIGLTPGLVGATVAAISGLVSIKALIAVAHRVNFAIFVAVLGALVIIGGVAQVLWFD